MVISFAPEPRRISATWCLSTPVEARPAPRRESRWLCAPASRPVCLWHGSAGRFGIAPSSAAPAGAWSLKLGLTEPKNGLLPGNLGGLSSTTSRPFVYGQKVAASPGQRDRALESSEEGEELLGLPAVALALVAVAGEDAGLSQVLEAVDRGHPGATGDLLGDRRGDDWK